MSRKAPITLMEEQILLGGKISHKHNEYMRYAQNLPPISKVIYVLENYKKLLAEGPLNACIKILEEFGKIDNFSNFGELTKLSAILGDPRRRLRGKKLKDKLDAYRRGQNSE